MLSAKTMFLMTEKRDAQGHPSIEYDSLICKTCLPMQMNRAGSSFVPILFRSCMEESLKNLIALTIFDERKEKKIKENTKRFLSSIMAIFCRYVKINRQKLY